MRQFLSLLVIVAVFGCISALPLSDERKEVERVLAETLKGDGEDPHNFEKEAHLINSHLSDSNVHKLDLEYKSMTPEQQASFKAKLIEGGHEFESHPASGSKVAAFVKQAVIDSEK